MEHCKQQVMLLLMVVPFSFNSSLADKDAVFAGDTQANLLFTDASTDRVGINTASPTTQLDVAGTFRATGAATLSSTLGVTGLLTASTLTAQEL